MAASDSFSFEPGIRTLSNWAELAFRILVSMSAMGAVMVMTALLSPARLRHAGHLAGVHHAPQADAAQAELPVDRPRAAAAAAARVRLHLELGPLLLLLDQCLLGHGATGSPVGKGS